MAELWWRTTWTEAIWSSDLKPLQRLVALVYAEHARDKRTAWVTLDRLIERSGLARSTAQRTRRELVELGWLIEVSKATQHKTAVFSLVIPEGVRVPSLGSLDDSRVPSPDARVPTVDARVPSPGTNLSSYPRTNPISLSREQQVVKDLLGEDATEERLMKVPNLMEQHNVRSPGWFRTCHKSGDLLALLDASGTEASLAPEGWGTTARAGGDGLMANPNYIEGTNAPRIAPEDYYRPKLERLGLIHGVIEQYRIDAEQIYPNGSQEKVWTEAWMTALTDHKLKDTA